MLTLEFTSNPDVSVLNNQVARPCYVSHGCRLELDAFPLPPLPDGKPIDAIHRSSIKAAQQPWRRPTPALTSLLP